MKIIVARFRENIDWTKNLDNVIIYNKGNDISNYNTIKLPNVGREGHTYYTHIYNNYYNLDDYTIFLQGNPFDHSPNILDNIDFLTNNIDLLKENNVSFMHLTETNLFTNLNGCKHHKEIPMRTVYKKVFGNKKEPEGDFIFGAGAQFMVSKEQIYKHPPEFYLNIIKILDYSINPIEGFVIERLHGLIFS